MSLQLLNIGSYYNYPGFESTGEFLCVVSKEYPNNINTDDIPPTDRAKVWSSHILVGIIFDDFHHIKAK